MRWPHRAAAADILSAINALHRQLQNFEATMTTATDNLNAKIDDLTSAVTDALAEMETEVETIRANSGHSDDADATAVNASADRIGSLSQTIRDAMAKVKGELSAAPATAGAAAPASASTAAPVALAGVPVTPVSEASAASAGPAVPSVDGDVTDASPNKDTSSPAPTPSGATAEVSGS